MAVPVSMALPEQFQHADLSTVAKHSDLLVERYRKTQPPHAAPVDKDVIMAQALASLANAVARLEDRLDGAPEDRLYTSETQPSVVPPAPRKENRKRHPEEEPEVGPTNGHSLPPLNGEAGEDAVVQLSEEEHGARATPLEARLLVRREAAAVAHNYERKSQRAYDQAANTNIRQGWFSNLMERHPVLTVVCTAIPSLVLVGYVIFWMYRDSQFEIAPPPPQVLEPGEMAKRWESDPAATQAELVAKLFLFAPSAREARDVVYRYDKIAEKFERLYRPLLDPGSYELVPKGRQVLADGRKVFSFQVSSREMEPRTLVVVPEGTMPKVHWEFFAEVGDMSWEEFFKERPATSVAMRSFVQESNVYFSPYNKEEWQSFLLHDREKKHLFHAFARRNGGSHWKLSKALEESAVNFDRQKAVRAQVEVAFMAEIEQTEGQRVYLGEIKDVPMTSWLPKQYIGSGEAAAGAGEEPVESSSES